MYETLERRRLFSAAMVTLDGHEAGAGEVRAQYEVVTTVELDAGDANVEPQAAYTWAYLVRRPRP